MTAPSESLKTVAAISVQWASSFQKQVGEKVLRGHCNRGGNFTPRA